MTNPDTTPPEGAVPSSDHLDPTDRAGTERAGALVRHALAAVAATTQVEPRRLDVPAPVALRRVAADAAEAQTAPPWGSVSEPEAVHPVQVVPVDPGEVRAPRRGRGAPAVAVAAAVVVVLVGLVAVVGGRDTVSTVPGDLATLSTVPPSEPAPAPAPFDDATLVSPPRTIGGFELADVRVTGWRADGTTTGSDPAAPSSDGSIPVTANPVLPPFIATGPSGIILDYSYAPIVSDGGNEAPVHVFVRTGVTLDAVGADMPSTEPSTAVEGLTVARLDGCGPPRVSGEPAAPVPPGDAPVVEQPLAATCRTAVTAWTADHVLAIDGTDAALVDEVLDGLRRETLVELEGRLAGVAHVGDIRRAFEAVAGTTNG